MKIRIRGNSIRLRLTRSEVATFCKTGEFVENTQIGATQFRYSLKSKDGIDGLEAHFKDNTITLLMPSQIASIWGETEEVGFENVVHQKNGEPLRLLVEKDFTCLDETVEDQSDNYPNPLAQKEKPFS